MTQMWEGAPGEVLYRFLPFCRGPGCTNTKLIAHGLCEKHYQENRRHGRLLPAKPGDPPPCRAPLCRKPALGRTGKGYCCRHLSQLRLHGRLLNEREQRTSKYEGGPCLSDGCRHRTHRGGSYCREHHSQLIRQQQLAADRRKAGDGICNWRKRTVTAADCRRMVEMRKLGNTHYDIANATGFSVVTVWKKLQKAGLTKTQKRKV